MQNACGVLHYVMNALLYLHSIKGKYIAVYNELVTQLHIYAKAVSILAKGYLPIFLITPYKLQEIINLVKETLIKSNPDYDIVIKRLHLYYDMKLVTFRIDQDRTLNNTISNFHATIYTTTTDLISIRNSSSSHNR